MVDEKPARFCWSCFRPLVAGTDDDVDLALQIQDQIIESQKRARQRAEMAPKTEAEILAAVREIARAGG